MMQDLQRFRDSGLARGGHPLLRLSDPIRKTSWIPALDLSEGPDAFTISLELPGVKPEDVEVTYEGGHLTVRGEKRAEATLTDGGYRRIERSFGAFERAVRIAAPVDSERVSASCHNGVLRISVPKAGEAQPRQIAIQ